MSQSAGEIPTEQEVELTEKGKKKAIKTIKVTGNANAKIAKMPKKKGTYYIRISKLTKKTNGTYEIGYY